MRRGSFVVAAVIAVTVGLPLSAQRLTEEQFLEDALTNHPDVAAARAERAAASGGRLQAGLLDNPILAWEREDPSAAATQDSWSVSWRLPLDGRRHRVAGADAAVAASKASIDASLLNARLELRELFAAWYVASRRAAVLEDHHDRIQQLAEWLRARAELGEAAGVEADRLDLEVEVVAGRLAEARAEARARRAAAASWSDLVSAGSRPARPHLAPPPASVDLSQRPDLVAFEHRVEEAEARLRLHKRVLEPPEVSVGWLEVRDASQSFDGPVFGVSWPLPVFDRGQGERAIADAEVERSRARLEAARRRALERAEATLAAYATLYRSRARNHLTSSAASVVDSVLAAFEAGEASLTDVLDTVRATVDARLARIETLAATLAAGRQLEAVLGGPALSGGSS